MLGVQTTTLASRGTQTQRFGGQLRLVSGDFDLAACPPSCTPLGSVVSTRNAVFQPRNICLVRSVKSTADPEAGALWVRIGYQRGARLFEQDPVHVRLENIGN